MRQRHPPPRQPSLRTWRARDAWPCASPPWCLQARLQALVEQVTTSTSKAAEQGGEALAATGVAVTKTADQASAGLLAARDGCEVCLGLPPL